MNPHSTLPHKLELLKVQLKLDAEARGIDEKYWQVLEARKKKKQRRRQIWWKPWLFRCQSYNQYETFLKELASEDAITFKKFLWVDMNNFIGLMECVGPRIRREDTFFRKSVPVCLDLSLILWY